MKIDYRVISIGALSSHPLWEEAPGVRTAHATTTLIQSGDRRILVDPALPAQALAQRLYERSGLAPTAITDVFLTSFRPSHRGGLALFDQANWWISEAERESVGVKMVTTFQELEQIASDDMNDDHDHASCGEKGCRSGEGASGENASGAVDYLKHEIALLQRCQTAPDQLADQVDLFPLPGPTHGHCGLLLPLADMTVVIAGDAVVTEEHLLAGQILKTAGDGDREQAMTSFAEVIEVADLIIPGHGNIQRNIARQPY